MFLQHISEVTIYSIQAKLEISTFWLLLQTSILYFYKNIGYYVIDQTINNTTLDIRKQTLGCIMFLKSKQSRKMKGKGCAKGRPHQEYITKEESSSPIVLLCDRTGLCLMNAMYYNFN